MTMALRYRYSPGLNGQANALAYLGAVQQAMGDHAAAIGSQNQALSLFRELGSPWGEASALNPLGDLQRLTGDYAAATASQERALQLYRDLGYRNGEAQTLNSMGELSLESALLSEACRRHGQALAIASTINAPLEETLARSPPGPRAPALVSEADFIAARGINAARGPPLCRPGRAGQTQVPAGWLGHFVAGYTCYPNAAVKIAVSQFMNDPSSPISRRPAQVVSRVIRSWARSRWQCSSRSS
jgi:tetratricopeptide (TPR) repeat protein